MASSQMSEWLVSEFSGVGFIFKNRIAWPEGSWEVTMSILLTLGRTREKPSTKDVGLSFVGVSLSFMRPENSLSEGLGPGPARHQGWARLISCLQGAYLHFLEMSLTLSNVTKQACVVQLALEYSASTEHQLAGAVPEHPAEGPRWSAYCRIAQLSRKHHVGSLCVHTVHDRKRAPCRDGSVGLILERGPLTEITDSSLRSIKTLLKEGKSKVKPFCVSLLFPWLLTSHLALQWIIRSLWVYFTQCAFCPLLFFSCGFDSLKHSPPTRACWMPINPKCAFHWQRKSILLKLGRSDVLKVLNCMNPIRKRSRHVQLLGKPRTF